MRSLFVALSTQVNIYVIHYLVFLNIYGKSTIKCLLVINITCDYHHKFVCVPRILFVCIIHICFQFIGLVTNRALSYINKFFLKCFFFLWIPFLFWLNKYFQMEFIRKWLQWPERSRFIMKNFHLFFCCQIRIKLFFYFW